MKTRNNTEPPRKSVILVPVSDVELWYAQAPDSSWRFPLFIEWKHDTANDLHYGLLKPAFTPYNCQLQILLALFSHLDTLQSKQMWLVSRERLESMLFKAPGLTPKCYYLWPDPDMPLLPPGFKSLRFSESPGEDQRADQTCEHPFSTFIAERSGLPSSVINIVMRSIRDHGAEWLLKRRGVIEFGFCQLVALPFRSNWKAIVAEKFRGAKLAQMFASVQAGSAAMYEQLSKIGMEGGMVSLHNIGLRNGRVQYTLEAIPTKAFRDSVQTIELARMRCGHMTYVAEYEKAVEKLYSFAVRALANYVRQASLPFAKIHRGGTSGILRFLSAGGKQVEVRGVALDDLPVYIIPPDSSFSVLAEEGEPAFVPPSLTKVSEVPFVLPPIENLRSRQEWRSVDQLVNEGGGTIGLPMRHDEEGDVHGEPMLPVAEIAGGESGVDTERDRP